MNSRKLINLWITLWSIPAAVSLVGVLAITIILQVSTSIPGDSKILFRSMQIVAFVIGSWSTFKCWQLIKRLRSLNDAVEEDDAEEELMKGLAALFDWGVLIGLVFIVFSVAWAFLSKEGEIPFLPITAIAVSFLIFVVSSILSDICVHGKTREGVIDLTDYLKVKFPCWMPRPYCEPAQWWFENGTGI